MTAIENITGRKTEFFIPRVGTARCAVRTPQRGVPTFEEFCRAPNITQSSPERGTSQSSSTKYNTS
jgi:hypothetical protein